MAGIDGIAPNERQLNLLLALVQSTKGLTKVQVLRAVPGYGGDEDSDARGKMFDRDLAALRATGVIIATPMTSSEPDLESIEDPEERAKVRNDWNLEQALIRDEFLYKFSASTFEWPEGFKPSAIQSRLLQLAARTWAGSSLSEEMDMALTRLAAIGDAADPDALTDIITAFRPIDDVYLDVAKAIEDGKAIKFVYRKPAGIVGERLLSPWKFINAEGEWMLQGWDHGAKASRNFLLKRIVDRKIFTVNNPYHGATGEEIKTAADDLAEFQAKNVAKIRVAPESVAWNHFSMDDEESDVKTFTFVDYEILAHEIRRFGTSVRVLEPESLKAEVARGLEAVAEAHA